MKRIRIAALVNAAVLAAGLIAAHVSRYVNGV